MPEARTRGTGKRHGETVRRASDGGRPRSRVRGLTCAEVAQRVSHELAEITGLEPEQVTSLERSDDGTWKVTVELLELRRVPDTDDLIGSYEAELDEAGDLLGYYRVGRHSRCDTRADELDRDFTGEVDWDGDAER